MRTSFGRYLISDEKDLVDTASVCAFLRKSYWAEKRTADAVERSIENSLCFGAYLDGRQVAFARVVSDMAVVYYLCDVWVDEAHRGVGLGKALMAAIVDHPILAPLSGILATRDAHGLYEQYGFRCDADRFMRRRPPEASGAGVEAVSGSVVVRP